MTEVLNPVHIVINTHSAFVKNKQNNLSHILCVKAKQDNQKSTSSNETREYVCRDHKYFILSDIEMTSKYVQNGMWTCINILEKKQPKTYIHICIFFKTAHA